MIKEYQVTLFCITGKYKPVSTIVRRDNNLITEKGKDNFIKEIKVTGIQNICAKRYWTSKDLKKYNYTQVKVREYNKERIEKEKKEKYERIKKERGWE